jgi:catechol 2,3-dioxygenase-like lactoylglutathione lyase family enzyme
MIQTKAAFSGFSVNDLSKAKAFYTDVIGLEVVDEKMGLNFNLPGGGKLFIYEKQNHQPATYTILNFVVDDINKSVDQLVGQGVEIEHYQTETSGGPKTDEKGIARGLSSNMGPDIAWFKDPSGNVLSVLQVQ